jgi:hypothetical protein
MVENGKADTITLTSETMAAVDTVVNERTVSGARYGAVMQSWVDTEM